MVPLAYIVFVHVGEITIGGGFFFPLMVPLADILFVHAREITIGGGRVPHSVCLTPMGTLASLRS